MTIQDEEWRRFVKRLDEQERRHADHEREMIGVINTLTEQFKSLQQDICILFEKVDPTLLDVAVLKDRDSKRSTKDNAMYGAVVIAVVSAAVAAISNAMGWKR